MYVTGERQTMSHLMTCVDAPNGTWADMAMPTLASVNCANCQTLGGIYLIVNIEDSMKIKLTCDILVEVSSCLDVNGLPFFGCCFHCHMASKLSVMVKWTNSTNTLVSSETTLMVYAIHGALYNGQHLVNCGDIVLHKSSRPMVMP